MAEFQQGYVLQLLQEARNYIDEADDPREAIQESPVIMGLIQQLLQLALKDQEGPETATTTSGQEDDTTNPNSSSSGGDVPRPRTATPPPPHITTPLSDAPPRVFDPVDPDPTWIPKVIVPASNSEELLVSAECSVCGMDGVKGTFFRRGFTCSRCIGHHRLLNRNEPGATSASRLTMMEGHHYYASRCPTKECNGFTSSSSSTSPTTSTSSSPSALPTTSTTALPDNVAYLVSFVPHPSEDNATRSGLEVSAAFRRRTLEQLRLIAHPSMLFLFSCGEDKTRRRTFFVHEAATPLSQLVLTQRNDANTDPLVDVGSYSFFNPGTGDGEEPTSALSPASSPSPATPPRADSSSTLDLSVGTLIQTHVGLRVPGQHVEWVRKVAFAGLDALEHLHSHHMHHGHCTPSHLYVDDHGTIKLKATIVGGLDWQHHVHVNGESRFLPPEAATNQRHGQLLPTSVAVDLFMLGGTLVELLLRPFVGTCGDSEASDDDDRPKFEDLTPVEMLKRAQASCRSDNSVSGSLEVFFSFLEGLVHTTPSERPSSAKSALRHPVFTSLRVVNGIPAETMGATITVRHEGDAGAGDVSGGDSAVGSSYDLRRNRTVSWRADTKPLIDTNEVHSAGLLWFHRGDADSQSQLSKFLAEHGPKFQLVRSARSSMTLYSLKSDPRRRRAASVTDRVGSPMLFASSATSVASH